MCLHVIWMGQVILTVLFRWLYMLSQCSCIIPTRLQWSGPVDIIAMEQLSTCCLSAIHHPDQFGCGPMSGLATLSLWPCMILTSLHVVWTG